MCPSPDSKATGLTPSCTSTSASSLLLDSISQYPILASIATELTVDDILNFGLTSKDIWSCIGSAIDSQKLAKSVSRNALKCNGLSIQIKPINETDDDAYHMQCHNKRGTEIRRCQGCGVGVCETCRFRITHGTILTMPRKKHWFFPSKTASGAQVVNDSIECLVATFTRTGHGSHKSDKGPCSCTYEDRWLKKWLCVPCLNRDLYASDEKVPQK